ncbi:hypothetical protein DL95DRAFT_501327 [Leptodontidium sp. 2 PMI_412]|nr:hypothetical protein DL95DRAFT_501327 [Leptodontidium sp. 2 PMI_412]
MPHPHYGPRDFGSPLSQRQESPYRRQRKCQFLSQNSKAHSAVTASEPTNRPYHSGEELDGSRASQLPKVGVSSRKRELPLHEKPPLPPRPPLPIPTTPFTNTVRITNNTASPGLGEIPPQDASQPRHHPQLKSTPQQFNRIYRYFDQLKGSVHIENPAYLQKSQGKVTRIDRKALVSTIDEIIRFVYRMNIPDWEGVEQLGGGWWDNHRNMRNGLAYEMWGEFWEHEYVPWHQVNRVAVECFNRLRSPGPLPKRIPPELRCRASEKQRAGWELFQDTLPETRTTALKIAFRALPGPDVAAFLELMLVNNTVDMVIEVLKSFWGKSTKLPPVSYPRTSREIPSLMIGLSEVGNLLATLVVKLSASMDDEQTMHKGFECLDRIFRMVTKRNLGDPSPAIPSIFKHVLHRLEEPYVVLNCSRRWAIGYARIRRVALRWKYSCQ